MSRDKKIHEQRLLLNAYLRIEDVKNAEIAFKRLIELIKGVE